MVSIDYFWRDELFDNLDVWLKMSVLKNYYNKTNNNAIAILWILLTISGMMTFLATWMFD